MADAKISALTELTAVADGDKIPIVDVSDTSMAASGTTKFITVNNFRNLVGYSFSQDNTTGSTTTAIPFDNTIPQNTEGAEYGTLAYTPTASGNTLLVKVSGFLTGSGASFLVAGIFKDSDASAKAVTSVYNSGQNHTCNFCVIYEHTTTGTSSETWKLRYGSNTGTAYINRYNTGDMYGAAALVTWEIYEFS